MVWNYVWILLKSIRTFLFLNLYNRELRKHQKKNWSTQFVCPILCISLKFVYIHTEYVRVYFVCCIWKKKKFLLILYKYYEYMHSHIYFLLDLYDEFVREGNKKNIWNDWNTKHKHPYRIPNKESVYIIYILFYMRSHSSRILFHLNRFLLLLILLQNFLMNATYNWNRLHIQTHRETKQQYQWN